MDIMIGATETLTISPVPAHAPLRTITAVSKYNKNTITVGSNGALDIEAIELGYDEIVISDEFTEVKVFVKVSRQLVTGITIDNPAEDFVDMEAGEEVEVLLTISPATASQAFSMKINNPYWIVQGNRITPTKGSEPATLTVTAHDGNTITKNLSCVQSVEEIQIFGIKRLGAGRVFTCSARVLPSNADDKTHTFTSSDENVATIDADGMITAIIPGTTEITIISGDNSAITDSFTLTVV